MARVISIVNQKGGVGKTTTAINLATYLSHLGKSVLLIDLDPQANASSGLGIDYQVVSNGLYEVLSGFNNLRDIIHPTVHDRLLIVGIFPSPEGSYPFLLLLLPFLLP